MKRFLLPVALGLALLLPVACTNPGTNTTGTQTTMSQQVVATGYSSYMAASGAWLAYLTATPKPSPALVALVEPKRKAARVALDALSAAPSDLLKQTTAALALAAFSEALIHNNIEVK